MPLSARQAVLQMLNAFRSGGIQSGMCVEKLNTDFGLDDKDSALAVNIFMGCIQFRYKLDWYIALFSDIPIAKIDSWVMNILRMAVYQLRFLDRIPAHAAVDEAVRLCRQHRPRAVSFVNAVLRHIASDIDRLPKPAGKGAGLLSIEYSAEKWFVEYLIDRFGYQSAEAFLAESNKVAPLSLNINRNRITVEEYKKLLDARDISYSSGVYEGILTVEPQDIKKLPGFTEGFFFVQDPAAAACAVICGALPGMNLLDACSSPGGKSFSAAVAMKNEGSILACDINGKKIARVSEGAERLGLDIISCSVHDAKAYNAEFDTAFDIVIADVPCSGFGVLRKKPEIKYKTKDEISALPGIQKDIINNLSRYVKCGGTLLYSTCTVIEEENENIVEGFLSDHDCFIADDFEFCGIRSVNGMYTFLPNINGTDGFFAAKLIKIR